MAYREADRHGPTCLEVRSTNARISSTIRTYPGGDSGIAEPGADEPFPGGRLGRVVGAG
jgi:hypothetical protein